MQELNGEMRAEAGNKDSRDDGMRGDEVEVGPEQLDRSGFAAKEPDEEVVLASRTARPTERRLRTPERTPARHRRTENNDDASHKRLSMDVEDGMASIDDIVGGLEMNFHDDLMKGGASASGAGGVAEDSMMGVFSELNIVGITEVTEVFSPPRVVMQGMKIGLRAGSTWTCSRGGTSR